MREIGPVLERGWAFIVPSTFLAPDTEKAQEQQPTIQRTRKEVKQINSIFTEYINN